MTVHYKLMHLNKPFVEGSAEFAPVVGDIFEVEGSFYRVERRFLPHRTDVGKGYLNVDTLKLVVTRINEAYL